MHVTYSAHRVYFGLALLRHCDTQLLSQAGRRADFEFALRRHLFLIYNQHDPLASTAMFDVYALPAFHGAYVLHMPVPRPCLITIGRLGQYQLPPAHYFYVGSARGAGGLRSRVGRHLRGGGTLHWHIDYLRAAAEVQAVFYTVTDKPLECEWSQALKQLPNAFIPVPHFGASDCRTGCEAHLIGFTCRPDMAGLRRVWGRTTPTPVVCLRFF